MADALPVSPTGRAPESCRTDPDAVPQVMITVPSMWDYKLLAATSETITAQEWPTLIAACTESYAA